MADIHQDDINKSEKKNQDLLEELTNLNIKLPEKFRSSSVKLTVEPSNPFLHVQSNFEEFDWISEFRRLPTKKEVLACFDQDKLIIVRGFADLVKINRKNYEYSTLNDQGYCMLFVVLCVFFVGNNVENDVFFFEVFSMSFSTSKTSSFWLFFFLYLLILILLQLFRLLFNRMNSKT
jgi:hypothetical protein